MDINKAVIARLKKNGQTFEILVDCEKALELRRGKPVDINEVLVVQKVFKDAKKGELAPGLEETFKTDDIDQIATTIVKEGDVQLNQAYKKKLVDEKKNQILGIILRSAMDPVRKTPIPRTRLEIAMEQVHTHIDPFVPAEKQFETIVEKLKGILPMSFENKKYNIIISARHAASCYGLLKKYGKITKEQWLPSGALQTEVEVPAGVSEDFENALNKKTDGDCQIQVL